MFGSDTMPLKQVIGGCVEESSKPRTEHINALSAVVDTEFKVVRSYYDGCNPGYHFTTETM